MRDSARPVLNVEDVFRFWSNVDRTSAKKCWPWKGHRRPAGYGVYHVRGRNHVASRISLLLSTDKWPKGKQALHACHNPICVNPGHLRWGTPLDNMWDVEARCTGGRLGESDIWRIKRLTKEGVSVLQLALLYGVREQRVRDILSGGRRSKADPAANPVTPRHIPQRLPNSINVCRSLRESRGGRKDVSMMAEGVLAMRRDFFDHGVDIDTLAVVYRVDRQKVRRIVARYSWRHLP